MELVAWLALGVAALSLGWQIVDAVLKRRRRVAIRMRHFGIPVSAAGAPDLFTAPVEGFEDRYTVWPTEDEELLYVIALAIVNGGETTEYIDDIQIRSVDEMLGSGASDGHGSRELTPRGRVTWVFQPDGLTFDAHEGFIVKVFFASGKPFNSGPHFLRDDLRDLIDTHNAQVSG